MAVIQCIRALTLGISFFPNREDDHFWRQWRAVDRSIHTTHQYKMNWWYLWLCITRCTCYNELGIEIAETFDSTSIQCGKFILSRWCWTHCPVHWSTHKPLGSLSGRTSENWWRVERRSRRSHCSFHRSLRLELSVCSLLGLGAPCPWSWSWGKSLVFPRLKIRPHREISKPHTLRWILIHPIHAALQAVSGPQSGAVHEAGRAEVLDTCNFRLGEIIRSCKFREVLCVVRRWKDVVRQASV